MADATSLVEFTLPQVFGLPYGTSVLAVVAIALLAFRGAEWGECKFAHLLPR